MKKAMSRLYENGFPLERKLVGKSLVGPMVQGAAWPSAYEAYRSPAPQTSIVPREFLESYPLESSRRLGSRSTCGNPAQVRQGGSGLVCENHPLLDPFQLSGHACCLPAKLETEADWNRLIDFLESQHPTKYLGQPISPGSFGKSGLVLVFENSQPKYIIWNPKREPHVGLIDFIKLILSGTDWSGGTWSSPVERITVLDSSEPDQALAIYDLATGGSAVPGQLTRFVATTPSETFDKDAWEIASSKPSGGESSFLDRVSEELDLSHLNRLLDLAKRYHRENYITRLNDAIRAAQEEEEIYNL